MESASLVGHRWGLNKTISQTIKEKEDLFFLFVDMIDDMIL